MFAAYREIQRRSPWPLLLLVLALVAVVVFATRGSRGTIYQIETRHGVATLKSGMGTGEVEKVLGRPIQTQYEDGVECRRYGQMRFDAKFWVYSICYDGGRLVSLRAGQFEAKRIENIPHLTPPAPSP